MGSPDLRTVRVDISNHTRAQTQGFIAAEKKKLANIGPPPQRRLRPVDRRTGRRVAGFSEARIDFKIRSERYGNNVGKINNNITRGNQRISELNRKETITKIGTKDITQEELVARGASAAALARAKKRGQTRIVTRTAARRGRQKKVKTIIKGSNCNVRLGQDVDKLTTDEALCELNEKARFDERNPVIIGGRRIDGRVGGIKINEREARLITKVGKNRGQKEVFGFTPGLFGQASAGLGVLNFLNSPANQRRETIRVGGRSSGEIVTISRSKFDGTQQNILKSRARLLFAGGTNNEFDAILAGDIANRQSGRGAVRAVSGNTVRLNSGTVDPFFSGSINSNLLQKKTVSRKQAVARSSATGRQRKR